MFFAHSVEGSPEEKWQLLAEHLSTVSRLAGDFARPFGRADLAAAAGLLHDLGKYTNQFQSRLKGSAESVDHSTWGAKVAIERYPGLVGNLLAYTIAGHHAGLANGAGEGRRTTLQDRLSSQLPELLAAWKDEISLPQELLPPVEFATQGADRFQFRLAFLVRMLFSCLVDADFLDTEAFYAHVEGSDSPRRLVTELPSLTQLQAALDVHMAGFKPDSSIGKIRADILRHVREQAMCSPGLFSLTVPTGGGKTLASLAFALDHAIRHGQQRVIFVIPFTSIVEQNAAVFRRALGEWGYKAVLEHHSAFSDDLTQSKESREKTRLAMENWDSPIVVTTAVQFFESLFADRPSRCRKLHNIANSVIVLDEAQTMPLGVLRPCVAALDELARNYRSSVVLCTATQPALLAPEFEGGLEDVRELAPDPAGLAVALERVTVKHAGTFDDATLTGHLRSNEQVLCIVNNRRHARALYQSIADLPGARHLTTLMCARHRSRVLAEAKADLAAGRPCRLVSTSLIEAGVDIAFPKVLRAEAGLDSIAQAAGRCNREGKWAVAESEVLIFANANDDWAPPPELAQFSAVAREVLRGHVEKPLHPKAIQDYFKALYWHKGSQALDAKNLMGIVKRSQRDSLPMDTLAAEFKMIDSAQMTVIVRLPGDLEVAAALDDLQYAESAGGVARLLQPYTVQVPKSVFKVLLEAHAIQAVRADKWGDQFMVLINQNLYDDSFGLGWESAGNLPIDLLVQ